jgi:hypothetical protein
VLGVMTAFATLAMITRRKVGRIEAALLLIGYAAFLTALVLVR